MLKVRFPLLLKNNPIRSLVFFFLSLIAFAPSLQSQENRRDPFQVEVLQKSIEITPGTAFELDVQFTIPPAYYLYDEKTSVMAAKDGGLEFIRSERPEPENHFDSFFQKDLKVHYRSFTQKVLFRAPETLPLGSKTLELSVRYQGCTEDFCFRPIEKKVPVLVTLIEPTPSFQKMPAAKISPTPPTVSQPSFWELLQESNPDRLLNQGRVYLLVLAFVGGIFTSLTPCVLPIIPLTLAFIGVQHRRRGNLIRACYLVAGMVTMYAVLGFLAASLGLKLGFLFQNSFFTLFVALFFALFSLSLFDVLPLHLPSKWQRKLTQMGGKSSWGSFVAGLTIGLIASPCVGPVIAPLLLIASRSQDRFYGFLLLLNYGMGMGLLFLLLSLGYAELNQKIRAGRWTNLLKKMLACILLIPAFYYAYAFLSPWVEPQKNSFWIYNFEQGLQKAKQSQKPIMIDFYANWCPPCMELDRKTFSDADVKILGENFVRIKIDCSFNDENCQKATERFEVVGWPTVLFLNSQGEIIPEVHLIGGFADAEKMLQLMKQALEKK